MIYSAGGDIADIAPQSADAAVLWMRSGYNMRCATWDFRIANAGHRLKLVIDPTIGHPLLAKPGRYRRPWEAPTDSLWRCVPPRRRLRYIYVFANPADSFGYRRIEEVGEAVDRALNCLSRLQGVQDVAFIHIPYTGDRKFPTREDAAASGREMSVAIEHWREANPNRLNSFLLVDLRNDFRHLAPPQATEG